MAHRHLMAVCVVCLLCAEHLPCKEHVLTPSSNIKNLVNNVQSVSPAADIRIPTRTADDPRIYLYDKRKDKTKDADGVAITRRKRHAEHELHHHTETPEATKIYIKKLFSQYSNRNHNSMNVDEFEQMAKQLGLQNMLTDSLKTSDNSTCMAGSVFLEKMTDQGNKHEHSEEHHESHNRFSTFPENIELEAEHILSMCPILLYHIVNRNSPLEGEGCLNSSNFVSQIFDVQGNIEMEPRSTVWLYSTLSIIGVSLCGLFGVAVIPIMEKRFYHQVLQFLVALAVGTLAGDALLHLLPHAMMPTHENQDLHRTMMFRGLAAVAGIVFFYFFERFLVMITEWRQKKQKREKPSSRVRVMRDPESVSLNNGSATCKHKYSSYPYCYDEIAMETKDDHHEHQHVQEEISSNRLKIPEESRILVIQSLALDGTKINGAVADHGIDADNNTLSTSIDEGSIDGNALSNNNKLVNSAPIAEKKESLQEESYTIILR